MNFEILLNNFNFFINFKLNFSEEIVVLLIFYNFIKIIILGSVVELIWPTQYFNKKHNINNNFLKFRNFLETILKLRPIDFKKNLLNKNLLKYFLFKFKNKKNFSKKI